MDIQIQEKEYCCFNVTTTVPSERIEEKRAEVISQFRQLPVPGYRKGKQTLEATKSRYRKEIETSLKEALTEEAYFTAIQEKNLKPIGQPDFSKVSFENNSFQCDFELKTKPDFELQEYKGFKIPKPANELTAEEFAESLMQELRRRNGQTVPFQDDDILQTGDSALVDYSCKIDGEDHPELSAKKELIRIGQSPLPAFDENLLGMKMSEERTFDVPAPANSSETYAGKVFSFTATIAMASKDNPAPLDDNLATRLGFENLPALQQHLTSLAQSRIQESERQKIAQQVSARLVENHTFQIPQWLVDLETEMAAKRHQHSTDELSIEKRKELQNLAERNLRLSFVLEKVRESEPSAQLTEEELREHITTELQGIARSSDPSDVEKLFREVSSNGMLPMLAQKIRDDHTLRFLTDSCEIIQ